MYFMADICCRDEDIMEDQYLFICSLFLVLLLSDAELQKLVFGPNNFTGA